jgi:hypothetical protein
VEAGCIKGVCMDGMVLQHSWLCSWPCDEQAIVLQHCIAASGVDMAKQSNAYAARPTASSTITVLFAKRIYNQLRFVLKRSQATPLDDSPKPVGQQIGEADENLPTSRGTGQAAVEATIENQSLARGVAHGPKVSHGVIAQKGLREMPDLS